MGSQVEVSMLLLLLLITVAVTSLVMLAAIFVNRIRRQRGGVTPLPADSVTAGLTLLSKAGLSTERLLNNYYESLVGRSSDEWINVVANWLLSKAAFPTSDAATHRPDQPRGQVDFFLERLADAWLLALSERADVDCFRESTVRHLQQVLERNSGYNVDESVSQQQITVRFNRICRDAATLQQVTSLCYRETDLDEPTRLHPETEFFSSRYGEQTATSGTDVVPTISLENTSVSVDSQNSLLIESDVQTGEFLVQAAIVRKSSNGLASTNCNIVMKSISGRVCMELTDVEGGLCMSCYFTCLPEINLLCHPLSTDDGIKQSDVDRIENLIRSAIATAVVKLPFAPTASSSPSAAVAAAAVDSTVLQGQNQQGTFNGPRRQHRKTPETSRKCDKLCWRVVVKVIKANGLRETHAGCEPYCILQLDDPPQTYTTSPVKNTNNPFFDEQFLFESDSNSIMKINFELRDLRLPPNDNFLGRAELRVDDHVTEDKCILPLVGQLGSPGTTYGSLTVQILPFDPSCNEIRSLPLELSSKANDVILRTGSRSKPLRLPASEDRSNFNEFDQTSPNSSSTSLPPAGPVVCMSPSQQKRRSIGSVLRSRISKAMNRPSPSSTGRSLSADRASVERPSSVQNGTGTISSPSTPTSPTRQTNAASVGALSPTSSPASGTFRTSIDIRLSDPTSVGNVDSTTSLSAVPMHPSPAPSKRSAFRRLFRSRTKDSSPPAPSRSTADESGRSRSASGLRSDRRKYFDEWDSPQLGR